MDQGLTFFELSDSGDFLRITVLNKSHPNAESEWDQNWVNCRIETKSGAFSGLFEGALMTTAFERFKQELRQLYDTLEGTANFHSYDDYATIVATGDGIGHVNAKCTLRDSHVPLNELTFELALDQTFLPHIINQLNNITRTYPIIGNIGERKNVY
jgi:hypothetical protein